MSESDGDDAEKNAVEVVALMPRKYRELCPNIQEKVEGKLSLLNSTKTTEIEMIMLGIGYSSPPHLGTVLIMSGVFKKSCKSLLRYNSRKLNA